MFCEKVMSMTIQVIHKFPGDVLQQFTKVPLFPVHPKSLLRVIVPGLLAWFALLCGNEHVHCIGIYPTEMPNLIQMTLSIIGFGGFFISRPSFNFSDSSHQNRVFFLKHPYALSRQIISWLMSHTARSLHTSNTSVNLLTPVE